MRFIVPEIVSEVRSFEMNWRLKRAAVAVATAVATAAVALSAAATHCKDV
jgi:D-tyrosyl-tRNA(Tyr) deacylase